jgi:hypothetical protein
MKWRNPISHMNRHHKQQRTSRLRFLTLLLITILLVQLNAAHLFASASDLTSPTYNADVEGQVIDKRVTVPDLGLAVAVDAEGCFHWRNIPLSKGVIPTTITATAPGYGEWTIEGVRLVADDTLILTIELTVFPQRITVTPPQIKRENWPLPESLRGTLEPTVSDQMDLTLPPTIRVRITGYPHCDLDRDYTVETIDFKDYAKHVLPNEWVPTETGNWPGESLRAGAMAVKMYAWSYIAIGGKWPDADVYDSTCDQVYNPAIAYDSTNKAVDYTWNWRLSRDNLLVRTYYRAKYSQCPSGLAGNCMGQIDSRDMANEGSTWDEILYSFYVNSFISYLYPTPPAGFALRFYGNGYEDLDRVKIPINPHVPADVGGDFTIEWWMKAYHDENSSAACSSGAHEGWMDGNIIFDRNIYNDQFANQTFIHTVPSVDSSTPIVALTPAPFTVYLPTILKNYRGPDNHYGISMAGGRIAFGVKKENLTYSLCGTNDVADDAWHHIAVSRSFDGTMRIMIDGVLDAEADGPPGDISYPNNRPSFHPNDPYLVIGAEKFDLDPNAHPSFSGWIDEVRISDIVRYSGVFTPPSEPFIADENTVALYHFDEGVGNMIGDSSTAAGGPSDGHRNYGGVISGPEWMISYLFLDFNLYFPLILR